MVGSVLGGMALRKVVDRDLTRESSSSCPGMTSGSKQTTPSRRRWLAVAKEELKLSPLRTDQSTRAHMTADRSKMMSYRSQSAEYDG